VRQASDTYRIAPGPPTQPRLQLSFLRWKRELVSPLLGTGEMKASKLLALLAFAGLYGTTETQARSHKFEIKHLEKQRAERLEEHREARERINELNSETRLGAALIVTADAGDAAADMFENQIVFAHENSPIEQQIPNMNWNVTDSMLSRQRKLEEIRMRQTAREIARIDKAMRK
jgi:hypothetical protein